MIRIIDTHTHLDGEEFKDDLPFVVSRAKEAGVSKVFVPAIDYASSVASLRLGEEYRGYVYPMLGLHPEEVREDWQEQLRAIRGLDISSCIAIGEVGLDYYWTREYEREQLAAFEEQLVWSVKTRKPLMIHCRKAQNEMVRLLRRYEKELPGGVFHCFTGNRQEAQELLSFERFVLGIGGVATFKSSHLREVLPASVPMCRIVLETDSPYMAPVPYRGKRNESAFVVEVLKTLAKAYQVSEEEFAMATNENVERVFGCSVV